MRPIFLARHVYICQANDHVVFLDLRKDKYSCLGRKQSMAMQSLMTEHNGVKSLLFDEATALGQGTTRIVQGLVEQGLLVYDKASGKAAVLEHAEVPSETLHRAEPAGAVFKGKDITRFFAAAVFASIRLQWGSMQSTVRAVERRKVTGMDRDSVTGHRLTDDLVSAFCALRPYYPREYRCLFDSLALVNFLGQYGFFPNWIFGVQLEPFNAHCWVQAGQMVLNDTVENVRKFTPIMVV